jgi:hypothetical protein
MNTAMKLLLVLSALLLMQCVCFVSAGCKEDKLTFAGHPNKREEAAQCFFDAFGRPELSSEVLDCSFKKLPKIFRDYVGGDSKLIMDRCDIPKEGTFTKQKIMDNPCTCIQDLVWANRVMIVCNYIKNNHAIVDECLSD